MLRMIGIMLSIGLADSLNPSTLAPGLYIASVKRGRERLIEFTLGVFLVYYLGGVAIAVGPGELVLSLVPKPSHEVTSILEITAGVALLIGAALLIAHRHSLSRRQLPNRGGRQRSSFLLGAGITAVELPTAFPYFAAIAAVVGSGAKIYEKVILLLIFNVCFVLPLLLMILALTYWGERAPAHLERWRALLERRWPLILAVAALVAGGFVITLGVTGLTEHNSGDLGQLSREIHRLLPS